MVRAIFFKRVWVCLSIVVLLAACGKNDNGSTPSAGSNESGQSSSERVVQDAMGHEVKIPANPQRVLAAYMEDYLTVLGVKPVAQWSIGPTVQEYLQPELKGVPTIAWDLPVEAVTSFNPDLIFISSPASVQNGKYEKYARIAPAFVLGDELAKDWRKQLLKIGELLGKSDAAQKALEQYDKKSADAKAKLNKAIGTQSAAILWITQKQFYLFEKTRFSGNVLYRDLGLTPPAFVEKLGDPAAAWNPISLESLSELKADHIFVINKSAVAEDNALLESPIWKSIPAVRQAHVYRIEDKGNWTNNGLKASEQTIDE